jgi:predicted nucleic acid-binding protein
MPAQRRSRRCEASGLTENEPLYLDSSALVKLVIDEPESGALREALTARPRHLSSVLCLIELPRAVRRANSEREHLVQDLVAGLTLIELDWNTVTVAAQLEPPALRTLDAIHLASVLSVSPLKPTMITYDHRLADAAIAAGLVVEAPA